MSLKLLSILLGTCLCLTLAACQPATSLPGAVVEGLTTTAGTGEPVLTVTASDSAALPLLTLTKAVIDSASLPQLSFTATPQESVNLQSSTPITVTSMPVEQAGLSPTPTLACLGVGGRFDTTSLRSPLLTLPMEVRIYLPPCYDQQPQRRYPVLYLLHGQNFTESQWDDLGADETADRLIAAGEIPPFLIVMPHDRHWVEPAQSPFDEVFLDVLMPWVETNYRTIPERQKRAIGGLSRGGAWAVHLGLLHWQLFGAIGGHSAFYFITDGRKIADWIQAIPPEELPRIYLDIGNMDYLRKYNTMLEDVLVANNVPHEWYLFTGRHEQAYWMSHIEQYIRWYAQGWQE